METSAPNMEAFMETSRPMEAAIPQTSMETSQAFTEASAPHSQAFIEVSAISRRRRCARTSVHASMETLMPTQKPLSHQVTFCKRRNGLFKKAQELSVLCDAEVAAIIFSPSGKISEFASSSMSHIIKRYQSSQPQMPSNNVLLQGVERWKHETILLNSQIKRLEDFQSCIFGKNMSSSINELQSVESMLEHALNKICKRKMELFELETHNIIEKGEFICKENNVLKEKLMKIISTKECVRNASSAWKDQQDSVNTKLQLGLDNLQSTQEENSYFSET